MTPENPDGPEEESPGKQNQRWVGRHGGHCWAMQRSDRRWEPDRWELRRERQQLTEFLLWGNLD